MAPYERVGEASKALNRLLKKADGWRKSLT
jgi:hypothetical protein